MLKEKKGIFATRSPHRPNPVGVTLAKIVRIENTNMARVFVSGIDLVQGTPVIDIKPYVPGKLQKLEEPPTSSYNHDVAYDCIENAKFAEWIGLSVYTQRYVYP